MNDDDDFSQLDDPAVIAERARVRELPGLVLPEDADPALLARYQRITEEFDRRASAAWSTRDQDRGGTGERRTGRQLPPPGVVPLGGVGPG